MASKKKYKSAIRGYRRAAAIIMGLLLVLSGVLKMVDPVGTGLLVAEYFKFFGVPALIPWAKAAGIGVCLLESVTGAALIAGVWRKVVAAITSALILSFTAITLVLLIRNPEMDCGCFGRYLTLTHSQSFIKNLVFCALCAVAFLPFRGHMGNPKPIKYIAFHIGAVSLIVFAYLCYSGWVYDDRTPFAPGAELFNASRTNLDDAPILSFYDAAGQYADSLALTGQVAILSVYEPEEADWEEIATWMAEAKQAGVTAITLSTILPDYDKVFAADRKTLMTLNRSNGGVTYIDDGEIICKWTASRRPDSETLKEIITSEPTEVMINHVMKGKRRMHGFLLYIYAVLLLL